jgi:hypothetical protein
MSLALMVRVMTVLVLAVLLVSAVALWRGQSASTAQTPVVASQR